MTIEPIHQVISPITHPFDSKPKEIIQTSENFEAMVLQSMLKTECIDQHLTPTTCQEPADFVSFIPKITHPQEFSEPILPVHYESSSISSMSMKSSAEDFLNLITPYAKKASEILGIDPKLLIAQAALETGWGKFIAKDEDGSSSFNLFNIKSTHPQEGSVEVNTTEYIANSPVKTRAAFKKYESIDQSFEDYVALIRTNHRYKDALDNAQNPAKYITELQNAGYATDLKYAEKIISIYEKL